MSSSASSVPDAAAAAAAAPAPAPAAALAASPPPPPPSELDSQIAVLGDRIRQLKLAKQPIATELAELNALKDLKPKTDKPAPASAPAAGGAGKKADKKPSSRLTLKVPKVRPPPFPPLLPGSHCTPADSSSRTSFPGCFSQGTKDFLPHETTIRKKIFSTLEGVFQTHGASTIDTPVFELKEILSGKCVLPYRSQLAPSPLQSARSDPSPSSSRGGGRAVPSGFKGRC
jgi:hypothetical protein